ncbi:MAG: hypothetical protein QW165_03630 [Candidatus Woesearchaeota archaeon]
MAVLLKEVTPQCIGSCQNQNVLVNIDGRYVSLSALLQVATQFAIQFRKPEFTQLLSAIVRVMKTIQEITNVGSITIRPEEREIIVNLLKEYRGKCEFYFAVEQKERPGIAFSGPELRALYAEKERSASNTEKKAYYAYVRNKIEILARETQNIRDALLLVRDSISQPLTQQERIRRGYDLTIVQRAEKNAELLRSGIFKGKAEATEYTLGAHYINVPGMVQSHFVFAIDMLTGTIFIPREVVRHGRYFYEALEKDIAQFDYVYASPAPDEEPKIFLPPEYQILPLRLFISTEKLSEEAREVIRLTKELLFKPALLAVSRSLETAQGTLFTKLSKLRQYMQRSLGTG